jgi:hypothetical protein
MYRAIDGAESRYAAFKSTRSLHLAAGQRIEQMRSIADTMTGEI